MQILWDRFDSAATSHTLTTNPEADEPWTVGEVNALQAGIELAAANWTVRVTAVELVVRLNGVDVVLRPNGPGTPTQWTPNGGANWDRVDDTPPHDGDTTYVASATPGQMDLYSFQNLNGNGTISAIWVVATARVRAPPCGSLPPDTCWGNLRLVVGAAGTTYAYADGTTGMNTLTWMTTVSGVTTSFAYDANGNQRSRTTGTTRLCYDWNPENLMTAARQIGSTQSCDTQGTVLQSYAYDGLGRRVNMTAGSTWTVSIVAGMDVIYEKDQAGSVTKYVTANGMRIAKITPSGAVQYYTPDQSRIREKPRCEDTQSTNYHR